METEQSALDALPWTHRRVVLGALGLPGTTFPDVTDTYWAYKHIEYCVENGVVQGYEDGLYHPEIVVTRDQMAVYIARAFGL